MIKPHLSLCALTAICLACGAACARDALASTTNYSAAALFNWGNQAARAGKPALAILDYERALLLAPNDADVRANLHSVQATAGIAQLPEHRLDRYGRLAAPNFMYCVGLVGLLLGGGGLLAYRWRLSRPKPLAAVACLGAAMTLLSVADAVATVPLLNEAVVMQSSPACASPVAGADPQFTVPAAEVVHMRDQHGGFVLITDSQNREGWLPRSNVTPIIPAQERPWSGD